MNTDETKITAYLLGEIKDEELCREIESAIQEDSDLKKYADELRHLQSGLSDAFENELYQPMKSPSFHEKDAPGLRPLADTTSSFKWVPWVSGLAASVALIGCLIILSNEVPKSDPSEMVAVRSIPTDPGLSNTSNRFLSASSNLAPGEVVDRPRVASRFNTPPSESSPFTLFQGYSEQSNLQLEVSNFLIERDFSDAWTHPLSEFPINTDLNGFQDLETALSRGRLPSPEIVQIDSLLNAFNYNYLPAPTIDVPFAVHLEQVVSPWISGHTLLRVGVKGYELPLDESGDASLVFLVDVSGSMDEEFKLPLVSYGIKRLTEQLDPHDRMAIVTYGGASELILPSTMVSDSEKIMEALSRLVPGGNTLASAGILEAYRIAEASFIEGGNNRVVVCTDGDLSLGLSDPVLLNKLVSGQAARGVSLSTYGFSVGEKRDFDLEELAGVGNGQTAYIKNRADLENTFVGQVSGATLTIAQDVKLEVEFNPEKVDAYRLIGYEKEDPVSVAEAENDPIPENIQSGHSVTALYEVIPAELAEDPAANAESIASTALNNANSKATELVTVRVHYQPEGRSQSELIEVLFSEDAVSFEDATPDFQLAAAVTGFGQLLRNSRYKGDVNFEWVISTTQNAISNDASGYRNSFLEMVRQAEAISNSDSSAVGD